ncbi:MAG TPA: LPS assembly protein LptD [Candidatus Sulfotelmatobacter sp.]|nr:LPS assembly protein LptD [Candidatus Sulfotelmatobacter sp.]
MNLSLSIPAPGQLFRSCSPFLVLALFAAPAFSQQLPPQPPPGSIAEITAKGAQRRVGSTYIADDDVDISYGGMRLRADHVEYDDTTSQVKARGHIIFDFESQHIEGEEADYNVATGKGVFKKVHGFLKLERRPNPRLLVSRNPLYFQAEEVDRLSEQVYILKHSWITICDPQKSTWQFFAPKAKLTVQQHVAMVNSNFRLYRIPLVWLPYATAPAGEHVRESGFLLPLIGNSTQKGFVFGDAFYWAPRTWFDTTLGFDYFSSRGTAQRGQVRARPFEGTTIRYDYFGVIDRGIPQPTGPPIKQGGHQQTLEVQSLWHHGWRFVADVNQLSSLTFQLAFGDTYSDAINSEIRSAIFLTNNFHGFSFNVASLSDRSYLELSPPNNVYLRSEPEARFSSVEQAPWQKLPVYFSFDSFAGAVHREDQFLDTPNFVARTEFAPKLTIPFHFRDLFGLTATAAFRTTYYGDSLNGDSVLTGNSITRNTGEFALEFRPATLERFFDRPRTHHRYKHTIEPEATYRYVTGVHNFADFVRFDSNATLTDTNEIEYGIVQHLFVKSGDDQPVDFLSWRLVQKHYFDPTFGGALIPGQRNVFEALDSITAFAFASTPRNWSPIVSDVKLTPGGRYDAEQILEYDTQLHKLTTIGTLLKLKPYRQYFFTLAHFRLQGDPIVQPLTQQIRVMMGYGELNSKGFNASTGISYDINSGTLQNQFVQLGYNGGCCGLTVEYRRINLGTVRDENQFRVALILANLGTFGNLRHQERIY